MIDETDILHSYRDEMQAAILGSAIPPRFQPLPVSEWIAASLLQKAIRRGRVSEALVAASTLLNLNPVRFWRRLGMTAWEDIGIADIETVGLVTCTLSGSRVRKKLGSEWAIAAFLIAQLCAAPKSRGTDDLLMVSDYLPDLGKIRSELAGWDCNQLHKTVLNESDLAVRSIALRYLWGIKPYSRWDNLLPREGDRWATFGVLDEYGVPRTLIALIGEALRTIGTGLPLLAGLLFVDSEPSERQLISDSLPPEIMSGPVPGWALDTFTREGKEAFRRLLRGNSPLAHFLTSQIGPKHAMTVVGRLVFFTEGGLLIPRMRDEISDRLRHLVGQECRGVQPGCADEAIGLMQEALPELNRYRADVLEGR